jgi:hypothetical protein
MLMLARLKIEEDILPTPDSVQAKPPAKIPGKLTDD